MLRRSLLMTVICAGLATMAAGTGRAWAFADGGGSGGDDGGGYDAPHDDDPPPSDYNYNSDAFSVTMSRNLDQGEGAGQNAPGQNAESGAKAQGQTQVQGQTQAQASPPAQTPKRKRGFFHRIIHDIFGGD